MLENGNTVEGILIPDSAASVLPQQESHSQSWAQRCTFFLFWAVGELGWGFLLNWFEPGVCAVAVRWDEDALWSGSDVADLATNRHACV